MQFCPFVQDEYTYYQQLLLVRPVQSELSIKFHGSLPGLPVHTDLGILGRCIRARVRLVHNLLGLS